MEINPSILPGQRGKDEVGEEKKKREQQCACSTACEAAERFCLNADDCLRARMTGACVRLRHV